MKSLILKVCIICFSILVLCGCEKEPLTRKDQELAKQSYMNRVSSIKYDHLLYNNFQNIKDYKRFDVIVRFEGTVIQYIPDYKHHKDAYIISTGDKIYTDYEHAYLNKNLFVLFDDKKMEREVQEYKQFVEGDKVVVYGNISGLHKYKNIHNDKFVLPQMDAEYIDPLH